MREIRYALRVLRRSPGFAAIAILSLALGIGANAAIFSVSWALFAQPLPVAHPESLFAVANQLKLAPGRGGMSQINGSSYRDPATGRNYRAGMSFPAYAAIRSLAGSDADVFGYTFIREANISVDGWSTTGAGALVSGNYFRGAGVPIVLGRALTEEDDRPGASAAVISHRFWVSGLGGDAGAIGKVLRLNGVPFTIVGVSGPGFAGMSRGGFFPPMDVAVPLRAQPAVSPEWAAPGNSLFGSDAVFWIHVMARVDDVAKLPALQSKFTTAFAQVLGASSVPSHQQATEVEVRLLPGGHGIDELSRRAGPPVRIMTAVVAVVLVLACVNLANLMLARGVARQREISIRLALGSGRLRLVRQAVVESLLLAVAGGALGLLIGVFGGRALLLMLTASSGPIAVSVAVDWRMLAMTAGVACAATLVFGVLPAVRLLGRDVSPTLKVTTAGGTGAPRLNAGRVLMALQVAVSVPLVAGAAIFLQTLYHLGNVDLGFNPDRLISFRIDPTLNGYDRERVERTFARILDRVREVPGVSSVTLLQETLLSGISSNTTITRDDGSKVDVYFNRIGPDYFTTLGIALIAGRAIDARDNASAPGAAVINETAARTLFGAAPAIGRHLKPFGADVEVVGVVRDTKYESVRKAVVPTMFMSYQLPTRFPVRAMHVVVRTAVAPVTIMRALRAAAGEIDPDVPISRMKTQQQQIEETLGTEIAFTRLLVGFGAFALFLACIGLHGVTAYSVARRTSEIGVRIALGARRGDVLWLVLRQVVIITAAGLALGVPLAVAGGRAAGALLYGVAPADPPSLAAATLLMAAVAAVAGYFPARRAARLDPLVALRVE